MCVWWGGGGGGTGRDGEDDREVMGVGEESDTGKGTTQNAVLAPLFVLFTRHRVLVTLKT